MAISDASTKTWKGYDNLVVVRPRHVITLASRIGKLLLLLRTIGIEAYVRLHARELRNRPSDVIPAMPSNLARKSAEGLHGTGCGSVHDGLYLFVVHGDTFLTYDVTEEVVACHEKHTFCGV